MATDLTLRESDDIQGDVLAGFKKDQTTLLFLKFEDAVKARTWLQRLTPRIATTRQVATFNKAFSEARKRSGGDPTALKATWLGIAFTHAGLQTLTGKDPLPDAGTATPGTTLDAFKQGPSVRAPGLGDTGDNSPERWVFGNHRGEQPVHAVLTVASDTAEDLQAAVIEQREAAAQFKVTVVFQQNGATLPGTRRGKEHFGFKDGVSEPGVRGFDEPDPLRPEWVKDHPGTRLIPAGEFVCGHPRANDPANTKNDGLPPWTFNGSFQVVRRLAQDVPGWWAQVGRLTKELKDAKAVPQDTTTEWVAARLVGRWRSGTPVAKCPFADTPFNTVAANDNDITFLNDLEGEVTPLFSHLRKTNPRDGLRFAEGGPVSKEEEDIDTRRIMRRGSPYGHPFDPASEGPGGPDAPRGLLFVCYQSDLVDQFEFIQASWIDNSGFPQRKPPVGPDPMVGTDGAVHWKVDGASVQLGFQQFVRTEGAVYAFSPSVTMLKSLGEGRLPGKDQTPVGRPVDTFLPVPDRQPKGDKYWYWAFRSVAGQQVYRAISIAAGNDHTDTLEAKDRVISEFDSFAGITQVDFLLPFPDAYRVGGKSLFWLFHTLDNQQQYRVVSIADDADHTDKLERKDARIDLWQSFAGITKVDFVLPVMDRQPHGSTGKSWYWVFHTVNGQQLYRVVTIEHTPRHTDVQAVPDRRISEWDSFADISRISTILPIPDLHRVDGLSHYWVFHRDQYRITSIADGDAHQDRIVVQDRPVALWKSLTA